MTPAAPVIRMQVHSGTVMVSRRATALLWLLLFMQGSLLAQAVPYATSRTYDDPGLIPPEHPVDMLRMRLTVAFVPEQGLVRGNVTHVFSPLRERVDTLFFHGPGIRITRALLNNAPVRWISSAAGVTVFPDPPLRWDTIDSITFTYEATPRRGIYFIGWNDTTGRRHKQIWTQGQGVDNRHWIPCYDEQNDKLLTETIVTFDSAYQVLSNGDLLSVRANGDGTKTWHFAMSHPHAAYLVMLAIGRYGIDTRRTRTGVPVHLYYYPEHPERVGPTYLYSTECIDFVAAETGVPFPWSTYANIPVEDFLYGAMENTTATVYGDFLLVDRRGFLDRNYIAVNVHELTHQWFGDFVTGRAPAMAWLHESFATFYPKLFLRKVFGEEYYEWMRRSEQNAALAASVQNRLPLVHSQAGSARAYQKGSAVLDMMVTVFGQDAFRRVIQHYLRQHAYGLVETSDLYQAFQDVLGLSPSWFFEEWIYRGGEPHYEVHYRDLNIRPGTHRQTEIIVRQIHPTDELVTTFRMPILFEVHYTDGTSDQMRQTIERETERVLIPNRGSRSIAYVLFDPGSTILKKVTFVKPLEELRRQALEAPHMIDRYDAVAALKDSALVLKRATLHELFRREASPYIRAEIAAQLAGDSSTSSLGILREALHDSSVEVRSSAFDHMRSIPRALQTDAESLIRDSSYVLAAAALQRLAELFPERVPQYLEWTAGDEGVGHQLRILCHELRTARGDSGSLRTLVAMCGPTYEFRTRLNAFEAVKRLNAFSEPLAANLMDAALNANGRLRGPAAATLQYFMQQSRCRTTALRVYRSHTWTDWQKELLAPLME